MHGRVSEWDYEYVCVETCNYKSVCEREYQSGITIICKRGSQSGIMRNYERQWILSMYESCSVSEWDDEHIHEED